jgi:hypothetical protein
MPILRDEPVARHGWWRVGGPLDRFVIADASDELVQARRVGGPLLVLGNGSNLLAPESGVRGTAVRLGAAFRVLELVSDDGDAVRMRIGAGLPNAMLLARLARLGLGGAGSLTAVTASGTSRRASRTTCRGGRPLSRSSTASASIRGSRAASRTIHITVAFVTSGRTLLSAATGRVYRVDSLLS